MTGFTPEFIRLRFATLRIGKAWHLSVNVVTQVNYVNLARSVWFEAPMIY